MAKAKVLLAEDDLSLGFVIKDSLQDVDFEVTHCPDGEVAWQQFQKGFRHLPAGYQYAGTGWFFARKKNTPAK